MKFDGVPNAPVKSLREIIDKGLFDRALETRFRTADSVTTLDSESRRRVLERQRLLRARMQYIMDSLSLDALAYPTMRQRPVLIGEVQTGSTCNLSAQSGLPAISMPAGFTADGLPVGLELLGRAFTDTRLVSMAYAFEQSGARRRAPSTTPALVNGRAPAGTPIFVMAATTRAVATARFVYDAPTSALRWTVAISGAAPDDVAAVVLRRTNAEGIPMSAGSTNATSSMMSPARSSRVIARLLGPGMRSASGVLVLNGIERRALENGRLKLALYDRAAKITESSLPKDVASTIR